VQCEASHAALEAAVAQLKEDVASERAEKEELLAAHSEAMGEAEAMVRMTSPATQPLGGIGLTPSWGCGCPSTGSISNATGSIEGGGGGAF
jgi:hypothetical protein